MSIWPKRLNIVVKMIKTRQSYSILLSSTLKVLIQKHKKESWQCLFSPVFWPICGLNLVLVNLFFDKSIPRIQNMKGNELIRIPCLAYGISD